jgi:hypothetical protein
MTEERGARAGLIAAAVGTLPFLPSLRAGLTLDDGRTVLGHPGVRGPFSLREIWARDFWGFPWAAPKSIGTWRPFATLTYAIDRHVGRGMSWPFHATNIALFALLLFVLERFLARWLTALSERARLATVVAFAVLAIHADVVPSVTGRAEILAMLGGVGALWVAILPARRAAHYVLMILAIAVALLSKESAAPIPILAAWLAARRGREGMVAALVALVSVTVYFVYRIPRIPVDTGYYEFFFPNPLINASFTVRVAGACEAITHYLQHIVAPIDLLADYSYAAVIPGSPARAIVGLAIIAASVAGFVRARRRAPELAEALAGLAASYLVVSHFLMPSRQFVADRNFFFPSFFVVVIVALLLARVRARMLGAAVVVVIVAQAVFAVFGTLTWHSQATLADYSVRTAPASQLFRRIKGETAFKAGDQQMAAWSYLVASAIERRFPARIADDVFPIEWEDAPYDVRLSSLRARVGSSEACALRDHAATVLESNEMDAPAQLLRRWTP